jgi:hypothetical protein
MGEQPRVKILVAMTIGVAAVWGGSCGGGSGAPSRSRDGGAAGRDGGTAGHDGGGAGRDSEATDAAQCPTPDDLAAEPTPRQVALDGGVPLDQVAYAMAVARCNYLSRCFSLSAYVANDCVDSLASTEEWGYPLCDDQVGSLCITGNITYFTPSVALLQAAAAGVVRYDPQQEAKCIAALLAEGCASDELLEYLPACGGVFTCPSAGDGGSGLTDGGAGDGGSTCAQFVSPNYQPYVTCFTDEDCAGADATPQGSYCVAGFCAPSRCGIVITGCTTFATVGQPCHSNAESIISGGVTPDAMCAPGLACYGRSSGDGGVGTCVVPVDVGGTCTEDSNCKPGLVCACGTCEIPPASGPCVNGLCEVGVAYCNRASGTCRPVRLLNASCAGATNSCAPGLTCDPTYSTCQLPS